MAFSGFRHQDICGIYFSNEVTPALRLEGWWIEENAKDDNGPSIALDMLGNDMPKYIFILQ